ncbi:MAG TPA: hypothetical protein VHG91_05830 [Longimicrobium sp.]|nr:hypothetical protein [Longimicrobium sp.]
MAAETQGVELSELVRRYLWEHDPERITWESSRHTIVAKLLQVGGWDAVRWLRANVGDNELREFLARRRGRGIDPKRLRFWELVLDLPKAEVDAWIAAARADPWHRRTRG